MKCQKCGKENIKKANYCKFCGKEFSQKEKDAAKNKGFVAKLRKFDKWYEVCTLKVITDHILVKILIILLILFPGIYSLFKNGSHLKILDTNKYNITYNNKDQEYYIYLEQNTAKDVPLSLFVPNKIKKLQINYYNSENKVLEKDKINIDKEIILKANSTEDNYYIISATNNQKEKLKIYVYNGEK